MSQATCRGFITDEGAIRRKAQPQFRRQRPPHLHDDVEIGCSFAGSAPTGVKIRGTEHPARRPVPGALTTLEMLYKAPARALTPPLVFQILLNSPPDDDRQRSVEENTYQIRQSTMRPASNKPSKPMLCGTFAMETAFDRIEARSGGS